MNQTTETVTRFSKAGYLRYWLACLPVHRRYRKFTMIAPKAYVENLTLIALTLQNPNLADGALIECGTWKGGMSAGMIEVGGPRRKYHFFDSFEGLPPPGPDDGDRAQRWNPDTEPDYRDNCAASIEEFRKVISRPAQFPNSIDVRKGFFKDSFVDFTPPPVAVLRLDGDWYESTMECLEKFWDSVLPGGIILIDDYHDWDGCARAVHDFLSRRKAVERVSQGPIGRVAYIVKHHDRAPMRTAA